MGRRKAQGKLAHGILLIDKPQGISSFDVIRALRRATQVRKMGHTGTLDPMATGLLVICLGEATKLVQYLTADAKRYEAEISFGITTDTYDAEGDEVARAERATLSELSRERCERELAHFLGPQQQRPPAFSAIKVDGERLYERARRGEVVEVPLRSVTFHELALRAWSPLRSELPLAAPLDSRALPRARVGVHCSKGTYIRSLAMDLGAAMGCGAHLSALRRTSAGAFSLDHAHALDTITEETLERALIPLVDALPDAPRVELSNEQTLAVRQGKQIMISPELAESIRAHPDEVSLCRGISPRGELIALLKPEEGRLKVARGFPEYTQPQESSSQ